MMSGAQLNLLAETFSNIGLLFLGSLVVPIFTATGLAIGSVLSGLTLSFSFWITGLYIIKRI